MVREHAHERATTHGHKNPLVRLYFNWKWNIAIKLADLNKDDLILDFGCGTQELKRKLPNHNVIGYDLTPEHSDVKNYTEISPTKIFALDVLEHIPKKELEKIFKNFQKMNKKFALITIIPTENWVSRKLRKLISKPERVSDHVTTIKEILDLLKKYFKLEKKRNFFTISYIGRFSHGY